MRGDGWFNPVATTLSVAGRAHPPHLQTWRDGWRSIRYLCRAALPVGRR